MTRHAAGIGFVVASALSLSAMAAHAQSELVYKAKYDLQINNAIESRSVKSRVQVSDGGSISIEIGTYRAEIEISQTEPGYYAATLRLLHDDSGMWTESKLSRVSFSGEDGEPVWFQWRTAEIDVRLELVASGARQ